MQRCILFAFLFVMFIAMPAVALDQAHWQKADAAIDRGIAFLRASQNADGSWSPKPGPAITALAVSVMLDQPEIDSDDPTVRKGLEYILSKAKPDGGIHDGFLENYNTAISLSALSRVDNRPDIAEVVAKAQLYLRDLQWHSQEGPDGRRVDPRHPYYGGAGYGKHGRPDMSNTQFMVQAFHDSGIDCNDVAFERAIAFISRCQGVPQNDLHADKISQDGGFIYSTSINKDLVGVPESKANPQMMDEAKQGKPVSGLRTYGSITYAGFKSYIYADLDRDDPRVQGVLDWISRNYTLEHNPGMPAHVNKQGWYYYFMTFGRAMSAWGSTYIKTADGKQHDWANDLIAKLASLQREDGSWKNVADRWYEDDPNLVTCYSLIALQSAIR